LRQRLGVHQANWGISKSREMDRLTDRASPEAIAQAARRAGAASVAFTYNDPTIFAEYAMDVADACHALGVKTVSVTVRDPVLAPRARRVRRVRRADRRPIRRRDRRLRPAPDARRDLAKSSPGRDDERDASGAGVAGLHPISLATPSHALATRWGNDRHYGRYVPRSSFAWLVMIT
jgi:hypothetical protein